MKKFLRMLAIMLLSLIALIFVFALVSGKTYLFRAVAYNFADIDDYKIFSNNTVSAGIPQPLAVSADLNKTPVPVTLDSLLGELETVSFLKKPSRNLRFSLRCTPMISAAAAASA